MDIVTVTQPAVSSSTDVHPARFGLRPWWRWMLVALAFPVAGYTAHAVAGPVDSVSAAILGGVITGAGIGAAQWALLRRRGISVGWIPATAAGLGAGLAAGAALVSYRTDISSLVLMGAISGLAVGIAQGAMLGSVKRTAAVDRGDRRLVGDRLDGDHRPVASASMSSGSCSGPMARSPPRSCRA